MLHISQYQVHKFPGKIARKRIFVSLALIIFTGSFSIAQNGKSSEPKEFLSINYQLDELLNSWYLGKMSTDTSIETLNRYKFKSYQIPLYSDNVYRKRLARLESPIPLGFNPIVKRFIELYVKDKRDQVENMLGLGVYYFPMIEEKLDKAGLPLELKYIPVIESALNTHAVSKSGATGLWQFMYGTGKMYGLEISSYVDARRDPFELTDKAILFLQDLYGIYKDWLMVIAAYNCGPGSVNKAIQRSGYKSTFWEIYPYLPHETRGYVPAFIAANYVMNYYIEHNLYPKNIYAPGLIDTIHIYRRLNFSVISKTLQMEQERILELNPQYKQMVIPNPLPGKYYVLRLPIKEAGRFSLHQKQIFRYQDLIDEKERLLVDNANVVSKQNPNTSIGSKNKMILYTVKKEDTKALIANWFGCTIKELDDWNNFPGGEVKEGKTVTVYVNESKFDAYQNINEMSFADKQSRFSKSRVNVSGTGRIDYYIVKPGDTLWAIAKKFPKSTVDDLKRINGLGKEGIKPGQTIKIRK